MAGKAVKAVLGKNIKSLRARKDFTQAILSEKADISSFLKADLYPLTAGN